MPLAFSPLALIITAWAVLHSKINNDNLTFEDVEINIIYKIISIIPHMSELFKLFLNF